MANWRSKIDVKTEWAAFENDDLTVQQVARLMVEKLNKIPHFLKDDDLGLIVEQFESIAEEKHVEEGDFDSVLRELYDWADDGHRLWIATF